MPGDTSRYVFSTSHIRRGSVKAAAFLPPNKAGGKTSIFLVNGCDCFAIWALGQKYVEPLRDTTMKARADVHSSVIQSQGLHIDHNKKPHWRHANITDWPETKDERKLRAQEIAQQAQLHKAP